MFEISGWLACLCLAITMLFRYLKTEHSLLIEDRQIEISGTGLAPHLEKIMFEVVANLQRRVAKEKRFEIIVASSDDGNGFTASCPQIDGLTIWGPTVEYALYEFGFALHRFTETMIENGETLQWT